MTHDQLPYSPNLNGGEKFRRALAEIVTSVEVQESRATGSGVDAADELQALLDAAKAVIAPFDSTP